MENNFIEKKHSKLAIFSFIISLLFFIYTLFANIFNFFSQKGPKEGMVLMRGIIFPASYSLLIFIMLFILNLISLIICVKKELKGKLLSAIGIIFSLILIGYITYGFLSGPK